MSASCFQNRPGDFRRPHRSSICRIATANAFALLLLLTVTDQRIRAQATQSNQNPPENLKKVSLEELGQIEVTTASKVPVKATRTPAVINIITKRAQETHGTLVSTGGGNVDQGFLNFQYGAGNSKGFNYRIYGKGFTRGPEFHPDHQQFDDWRMGQTGFRTDWDAHNRDRLTLQGDLYYGDAGQLVQIASYSPPYTTDVEQNAELSGGNLLGRWERDLGSGSNVQFQTYYDRTNQKQANFSHSRDTFDIDFIHHLILPGRQDFLCGLV